MATCTVVLIKSDGVAMLPIIEMAVRARTLSDALEAFYNAELIRNFRV